MDFYTQVTPIDVLEQSKIGSRPSRRTGQRSLEDLRSIPWVFSWSQSRFHLTGWFGVGTALSGLRSSDSESFELLRGLAGDWPFLMYRLIQIESNLLQVDLETMGQFGDFIEDRHMRDSLMEMIKRDYKDCVETIEQLLEGPQETRRISKLENIKMRDSALKVLHGIQIAAVREWRSEDELDEESKHSQLLRLLVLVNALAGGLKSTG